MEKKDEAVVAHTQRPGPVPVRDTCQGEDQALFTLFVEPWIPLVKPWGQGEPTETEWICRAVPSTELSQLFILEFQISFHLKADRIQLL